MSAEQIKINYKNEETIMNTTEGETAGTFADTTDETRTVPAGPQPAGEPDRPSDGTGTAPWPGPVTPAELVELVGGPLNGNRIPGPDSTVLRYEVPEAGGIYVLDPDGRAARWHVGHLADDQTEQLRPAAPVELELRPAAAADPTVPEQIRPAGPRRSRRGGR